MKSEMQILRYCLVSWAEMIFCTILRDIIRKEEKVASCQHLQVSSPEVMRQGRSIIAIVHNLQYKNGQQVYNGYLADPCRSSNEKDGLLNLLNWTYEERFIALNPPVNPVEYCRLKNLRYLWMNGNLHSNLLMV